MVIVVPGQTVTYNTDGTVSVQPNGVLMPPPAPAPRPLDGPAWQALADAQTLGDIREAAQTIVGGA